FATVELLDVCPTPLASAATHPRTPRVAPALLPDAHGSPSRPARALLLSPPNWRTAVSDHWHDARGSGNSQRGVQGRCSSAGCQSTRSSEPARSISSSSL